uniref:XK-related protein n=1 Tax=Astyanax mexicanus TaxID=7994 RepID=A0A3B1KE15_ASTMX
SSSHSIHRCSWVSHYGILFSLLGSFFFCLDVALDVWTIVSLYKEQEYVYMGLLIALLLLSSILVQVFSWIWYKEKNMETSTDKFAEKYNLIGPLHFLQLGVFLRCASLVELSIRKVLKFDIFQEAVAVHLKHDLSMLRLFETFSESIPQIVLMITIIMQEQELQLFTVAVSFLMLALTVMSYHRHMREFVPEDKKMNWLSSGAFFLWNLFLITPRVVAVALFASVLPCFIAVHFLCLWLLLVLCVWRQKTDFMENAAGEWLYRATVGLIWYFSWFNVSGKNTRIKRILYHVLMGADTALLLVLWFWRTSVESACRNPLPINPYVLLVALPVLYIIGLLLNLLYYWKFHPKREKTPRLRSASVGLLDTDSAAETPQTGVHKRMKNMDNNFW